MLLRLRDKSRKHGILPFTGNEQEIGYLSTRNKEVTERLQKEMKRTLSQT